MKIGDIVFVHTTNNFAKIVNKGNDYGYGETWYRTDANGIRYKDEMTSIPNRSVMSVLIKKSDKILSPTEKKHLSKLKKKFKVKEYITKLK